MTTFAYRDRRLHRIGDALDMGGADPAVVASLEDERSALRTDDWTVTDRTYVAVAEDWLWATTEHLKELVDADPVFLASGTAAILSDAQATAIGELPRDPGGPAQAFLDGVHVIIDDVEEVFTELVDAAHHAWLQQPVADRAYPFDDVGVLLPLRLETLFDAPQSPHNDDPQRWKLSLRVVPDEASIRRDDAHVGDDELAAVLRFWQSVRLPGSFDPGWLDGDGAGVAWATLSAQVTPARAAWLVAAVLPELEGKSIRVEPPPDMPTKALANRVGGLPPSLVVSAITRDAANVATWHEIGRLPMDDTRTIDPDALLLPLPNALATARDAWWTSWPAAIAVGLGGEWLLDDGLAPETLDSIHVVGIGDEPPDVHFRAQSDAGELGALRLGSPTNAVHGVPAASLATDADGWRRVARARIAQRLDPTIDVATSTGDNIERHLTGTSDALPFFPGADGPDDTQDSQRLAQALWPALHGHWLADIWESPDDAFRVSRWAFPLDDETIPSADELRMVLHQTCDEGPPRPLAHRLCPEGPLMPIRIGDQPYGLLPVTALSLWEPDAAAGPDAPEQQRVEVGMAQALTELRQVWAAAAHRNGTVVGVPTSRFIELLGRDALTRRYIQRWFAPVSAWAAPYQLDPGGLAQFEEFARDLYAGAFNVVGHKPETLYLTNGYWRPSRLPLIQPTQTIHKRDLREDQNRGRISLSRFLALVVDLGDQLDLAGIFAGVWPLEPGAEFRIAVLPDSLLIRLLVHVCQLDTSWLNAQLGGDLALPVLMAQLEAVRAISCELDQPAWNRDERDPDTGDPVYTIRVPDERRDQLERAMRATLDTAAHRIDPWITGFAWQRLRAHSSSPRHSHRLGAYGWLDGPFIGEPGPTDAGRLHAPSYNQALAALILRDKFLSSARAGSTNDSARNPWEMNISSSKARLAEEIADDVRLGFHIYEIVGRHVEDVIGSHQSVKELRTSPRYAMRPERSDPNEVCNGIEALRGLLAGDPQFPLQDDQRVALSSLDAALDTYGDLLMADGVMQLINRQTDRAAETMDAAAGFSRPPSFEFIRTPPSGYQLHTAVLGAVPYVSVDAVPAQASPLRIADPSLAAFVEDRVGGDWTWTAVNVDDDGVLGSVTIADLGLAALDTIGLSEDFLAELVRRTLGLPLVYLTEGHARVWVVSAPDGAELGRVSLVDLRLRPAELAALDEMTLVDRVRTRLGAPADSLVTEGDPGDRRLWIAVDEHGELLGMGTVATMGITPAEASAVDEPTLHRRIRLALHLPRVRVDPPPEHRRITDLVASLGERPATGRDLIVDPATQREVDAAIYAELVVRYERLHAACQDLVDALRASPDDAARIGLVRRGLSWGVTSISEPEDREALFSALVGVAAPATARPLVELVETIAKALDGRLAAAPDPSQLVAPSDIGTPRPDQEQRKREGVPDGVPTLAKAIADLASPKGRYAVMACWPRTTLVARTHLVTDHNEPDLDEVWLTVIAAVRPALARLEAVQLELPTPLQSWSSSPGNPWRTGDEGVVAQNLEQRRTGSVTGMSLDQPFVTAYGDPDAWLDAKVAVGLVDAFAEAVPMPQRSTMTAFGFNAPAARAPQAILLAVPPRVRQRLDENLVRRIVDETRELAHARTARLEDLEALQALAPTIWLESSGMHGIRLDPYPLFT